MARGASSPDIQKDFSSQNQIMNRLDQSMGLMKDMNNELKEFKHHIMNKTSSDLTSQMTSPDKSIVSNLSPSDPKSSKLGQSWSGIKPKPIGWKLDKNTELKEESALEEISESDLLSKHSSARIRITASQILLQPTDDSPTGDSYYESDSKVRIDLSSSQQKNETPTSKYAKKVSVEDTDSLKQLKEFKNDENVPDDNKS